MNKFTTFSFLSQTFYRVVFVLVCIFVCIQFSHAGDSLVSVNRTAKVRGEADQFRTLPGLVRFNTGIFFKPGANKSEVRMVMGPPTRIAGNIWYYGDSEVVFSVSTGVPVVVGYYIRSVPLRIYDRDPFIFP